MRKEEGRFINVLRCMAMLMIVLCHYVGWIPQIAFTGQILNVGVPVFFIISGFLYGQKTICGSKTWLNKQFIKIAIPLYIYYTITACVLLILGKIGNITLYKSFPVLLHLQGFVNGAIGNVVSGHLWFISYILLCYIITPLLQFQKDKLERKWWIWEGVAFLIINTYLVDSGQLHTYWLPGVLLYCVFYFLGKDWNRKIGLVSYIRLTSIMILAIGVRIVVKLDAESLAPHFSMNIYEGLVAVYTHCILAVWIFFTIYIVCMHFDYLMVHLEPFTNTFSNYSYEVYIVHYMFLTGCLDLRIICGSLALSTFAFLILTICYAYILHWIREKLTKLCFALMIPNR